MLWQLRGRYEEEVVRKKQSVLSEVLSRAERPSAHMVLCVAAVGRAPELELTDGWHSMRATLDAPLAAQQRARRLFVGLKLRIAGADFVEGEGGDEPSLRLHLIYIMLT